MDDMNVRWTYTIFLLIFQGGMKGVIWTDVFQTCIILIGLIVVLIIGTTEVGTFGDVLKIASDGGRTDIFRWESIKFQVVETSIKSFSFLRLRKHEEKVLNKPPWKAVHGVFGLSSKDGSQPAHNVVSTSI